MSWEIEVLQKMSVLEPEIIVQALADLWKSNPSLHKNVVINAYLDSKISLAKAAEELCVTRHEFEFELRKRGIPIRQVTKKDVIAEVQAITTW